MVIKTERVRVQLGDLDRIVQNLQRHKHVAIAELGDLDRRWVVERGLIAGAQIVFDVADHVLAGQFAVYPEKYEDSLNQLALKGVISPNLREQLNKLGGFRNLLVHEYVTVDVSELHERFLQYLPAFGQYIREISAYLERAEE